MDEFELYDGDYEYEDGEYLDDEGFESDYYEDWDNLEMGSTPTWVVTRTIVKEE